MLIMQLIVDNAPVTTFMHCFPYFYNKWSVTYFKGQYRSQSKTHHIILLNNYDSSIETDKNLIVRKEEKKQWRKDNEMLEQFGLCLNSRFDLLWRTCFTPPIIPFFCVDHPLRSASSALATSASALSAGLHQCLFSTRLQLLLQRKTQLQCSHGAGSQRDNGCY